MSNFQSRCYNSQWLGRVFSAAIAQAIEVLVVAKAYVIKKNGVISGTTAAAGDGETNGPTKSVQISWAKNNGPERAWELAKHRANFV